MRDVPDDDPMTRRHRWHIILPCFVIGIAIPILASVALGHPLPSWLIHALAAVR